MSAPSARLIALYLPQFHPIPENDEWWGKGFTEWTNTAKAKPLYRGHYQPHVPADLGFYDLRVPETRIAQAQLARTYGIEAFCYYHYWFAGKRVIERPFNEVLASGEPDFPFCLCWANQTWSGIWHGSPKKILIEQTYPGVEDHRRHFESLRPAFFDQRYVRVDGKPLFVIFDPMDMPEPRSTTDLWRELAVKAGLPGLFLVAQRGRLDWSPQSHGFDAALTLPYLPKRREWVPWSEPIAKIRSKLEQLRGRPTIRSYERIIEGFSREGVAGRDSFPCIMPNWDNTPRSGANGIVLHGSTPDIFRGHVRRVLDSVQPAAPERRVVFIKSWNEWEEGNHMEPDLRFGLSYLEVLREELSNARP